MIVKHLHLIEEEKTDLVLSSPCKSIHFDKDRLVENIGNDESIINELMKCLTCK